VKYVLFVCTHNAGRSQIAQAFFEKYAPADVRAESAGQEPAEAIWPNVAEAMREVGIESIPAQSIRSAVRPTTMS
jgi:arsenate reductase